MEEFHQIFGSCDPLMLPDALFTNCSPHTVWITDESVQEIVYKTELLCVTDSFASLRMHAARFKHQLWETPDFYLAIPRVPQPLTSDKLSNVSPFLCIMKMGCDLQGGKHFSGGEIKFYMKHKWRFKYLPKTTIDSISETAVSVQGLQREYDAFVFILFSNAFVGPRKVDFETILGVIGECH